MRGLILKKSDIENIIKLADICYPEADEPEQIVSITSISVDDIIKTTSGEEGLLRRIKRLNQKQLNELFVVMSYGREGYEIEDFRIILEEADNENDTYLANYLAEKCPLARYLKDGLAKLSLHYR